MDPIVLALILFTLSVLIGFEIITKVPPILHTPLVVASHAMAAIMVVSAIEIAGRPGEGLLAEVLGGLALLLGVINVVGGYVIEGHVPAELVKQLLADHPAGVKGLSVPGMPVGAPGMDGPVPEHYVVYSFDARGKASVYAQR